MRPPFAQPRHGKLVFDFAFQQKIAGVSDADLLDYRAACSGGAGLFRRRRLTLEALVEDA
jgi:hypothetical protein